MDAGAGTVVVLFRHRARDGVTGIGIDTPEVGVYEVADGRIRRSRMFHFDPAELTTFLRSTGQGAPPAPDGPVRER